MKIGKVPENILKRSIIRQLRTKREEVLVGAGVGEDCAALQLGADELFVMSTDPITGTAKDIGSLAIHVTVNDLATSGAEPVGVMLSVLLPEDSTEQGIREMMRSVEDTCRQLNVQTIGGHTEITRAVNQPIITVTGVGKVKKDKLLLTGGVKPGQDILLTKWIGLEGTSIIAKEKEQELLEHYSADFVQRAKGFDRYLSVLPEAVLCRDQVSAMHDVTEGGVFGALWEVAEASGIGLEIELKLLPVKQETIEICEFYQINPYQLISSGCMLMAADKGHDLVRILGKEGIHSVVVGKATKGKDRVLLGDDERRFLEPPKTDELYKIV